MTIKFNFTKKHVIAAAMLLLGVVALVLYFQKSKPDEYADSAVDFEAQQQEVKDLRAYAEQNGVEAAYAKVKADFGNNQTAGHDYAHVVGRIVYEKMNVDGFKICDSDFGFGCYHGLLEALIRDQGAKGVTLAREGCNKLPSSGQVASCLHGLGHGVMGSKGNIDKAIDECKTFATNERIYCYDGSYMEYYTGVMEDFSKANYVNETNPWQFCNGQFEEARGQCVRNQTLALVYQPSVTKERIVEMCNELPESGRDYCVGTVGLYAVQVSGVSISAVADICKKFSVFEQYRSCMESSAREFVFQNNVSAANQLCASDARIKKTCESVVSQIRAEYQR